MVDSLTVCGEYRVVMLATPFSVMYTTHKAGLSKTILCWAEHTMIYLASYFMHILDMNFHLLKGLFIHSVDKGLAIPHLGPFLSVFSDFQMC